MNIYFSNFASVDLKHETTEGVSLEALAYPPAYPPAYPSVPQAYYCPMGEHHSYPMYLQEGYGGAAEGYGGAAEGFSGMPMERQPQTLSFYYPVNEGGIEGEAAGESVEHLEETIESNIDWLLRSEEKKSRPMIEERDMRILSLPLQDKSCYLAFSPSGELNNRNLYNLFSNFGNISYIKKTKKTVFIKFRSA